MKKEYDFFIIFFYLFNLYKIYNFKSYIYFIISSLLIVISRDDYNIKMTFIPLYYFFYVGKKASPINAKTINNNPVKNKTFPAGLFTNLIT